MKTKDTLVKEVEAYNKAYEELTDNMVDFIKYVIENVSDEITYTKYKCGEEYTMNVRYDEEMGGVFLFQGDYMLELVDEMSIEGLNEIVNAIKENYLS